MSNKNTIKKASPDRNRFKKAIINLPYDAEIEIDAFAVENGKYPTATITVDDGSSDGRPWGCSGVITLDITNGTALREIADALLDAADFLDTKNAENAAKIKAKLAKKRAKAKA